MNNKNLYSDELSQQLTLDKVKELDEGLEEAVEDKKIEDFLSYLDEKGFNLWIIKAIRSLLGKGK